jgi:hypothetical protein
MTPANKIANATRAMVPAASRASREHYVPSTTLAASAHARTGLGDQTAAHRPAELDQAGDYLVQERQHGRHDDRAALRSAASPGSRPARRGHLAASGLIPS